MDQKNMYTTGIVLAFLAGIGLTFVLLQSAFLRSLQGSIIDTPPEDNQIQEEPVMTGCAVHEDCAAGHVCKTGECVLADKSFCSQPFMLAESVEGRFVRYTECVNSCVMNGDTAYCR